MQGVPKIVSAFDENKMKVLCLIVKISFGLSKA